MFQGCDERRWDWNPSHRLNCFARGHSCCFKEAQGKILPSYFQLFAVLARGWLLSHLMTMPGANYCFPNVLCLVSVFHYMTSTQCNAWNVVPVQ